MAKYLLVLTFFLTDSVQASLNIAVASNFRSTAEVLAREFELVHGKKINIVSGSSGKLFAQIKNGAPFDVFMSADEERPELLIKSGLADKTSLTTYAQGVLVLWGMKEVNLKDVEYISMANPRHAPYGMAAKKYLIKNKLWKSLENKIVYGENVAQTQHFTLSGTVDYSFISLAQAKDIDKGHFVIVPKSDEVKLNQDLVVLSKTTKKALANEFVKFIRSEKSKTLIKNSGYDFGN